MKIAVVGGGSTYTPELIDGFARFTNLSEVVLIDPSAERLNIVGPFAKRLLGQVSWTSDLDAGLDGASIVVIQLRVGGQQARISDETFPLECGCIGQETTGAGGLAKALRTVPVVLEVAARAAKRAPGAWIVNFTNPVGIVTRALLDAGHRAAGLCNVAIGFQRRFATLLGVTPEEVTLDHVGLNHLTWERAAYVNGVDRLPELLAPAAQQVHLPLEMLQRLGSVPSYYLRYFYEHDIVLEEQRHEGTRGEAVARIEAELLRLYRDPALTTKPELLAQRGGAFYSEAAVGLITSLLNGDNTIHAVNLRNRGHLPFLPDDAVIEVSCRVDRDGATALPAPPVEALYSGLIAAVSAYEELALQAALKGGRERVHLALLAHPLVGQHDIAERLTDRLLAANESFLPWARK
jgi:6-phospho-beta-glucosidase